MAWVRSHDRNLTMTEISGVTARRFPGGGSGVEGIGDAMVKELARLSSQYRPSPGRNTQISSSGQASTASPGTRWNSRALLVMSTLSSARA